MKRLIPALVLLTGPLAYLEWGGGQHGFLGQIEYGIFFGPDASLKNLLHPLILLPVCGQLLLACTLFLRHPSRALSLAGTALQAPLLLLVLAAGILSGNLRMILSCVPFWAAAVLQLLAYRKQAQPAA
ncbi:MAG: hypothetical protein NW241_10325 [Bacteroidia bacterium]|nr:hypothetical protein [Bacteroidia bacterium]